MKTEMAFSYLRIMSPTSLGRVYEKVARYLPDLYRSPEAFYSLYASSGSMFFEVGDFHGAIWLTDLAVGWKANVHTVLWHRAVFGRHDTVREGIAELMRLFRLQRLEAFIPTTFRAAGIFAERVGFKLEGILRRANWYDGSLVDMAAYSVIKGEE